MESISPAAPGAAAAARPHVAEKAKAREFESVFLGQMTKLMMEAAASDGALEGGHGEEMFRGVLAEQIGTAMAAAGGVGLAPLVSDHLIRLQEGSIDGR